MSDIDVLIVGAGPTGLALASQLSRYNINFKIIDKNKELTNLSKALIIHSRTLELLEQINVSAELMKNAKKCSGLNIIIGEDTVKKINITDIGENITPYPFLTILPQRDTEKALYDYLLSQNKEVAWKTELVSLFQSKEEVVATLKNEVGEYEVCKAKWVVGTDGAKSVVRHAMNFEFEGGTYEPYFYLMDCTIEGAFEENKINLNFINKNFISFFPFNEPNTYRVLGVLPDAFMEKEVDFLELKEFIEKNTKMPIKISNPTWISMYKLHHRHATAYRKDRVFIAGDAAHIHSPAGGQGMNTGIQDAWNLGWKLAMVVNDLLDERILDTYEEERLPIAEDVVKYTDKAFANAISQNWLISFVRNNLLPIGLKSLMSTQKMRKFAFKNISQIAIHYHNSSLSREYNPDDSFDDDTPQAGDRFPFMTLKTNLSADVVNSFDFFKDSRFQVICFNYPEIESLETALEPYKLFIRFISVPHTLENEALFQKYYLTEPIVFIVRPDGYIAFRSKDIRPKIILKYIQDTLL